MNKLISIIFAILIVSCKSNSQDTSTRNYDIDKLEKAYTTKSESDFLKSFPTNFSEFKETFGWDDIKDSSMPLYDVSNDYIDYWFSLIKQPKYESYENEIISISKEGKWEADAVNVFIYKTKDYIKRNKKYNLINDLSQQEATSVLSFLFGTPYPKEDNEFVSNLTPEKQEIVNHFLQKNVSIEKSRSSIESYEKNEDFFIREFDVNKDGTIDKVVSNTPYTGDELFVFLNKNGKYNLALETTNFSQDGGNIIENIYPISENSGFMVKTHFPDRGYYEEEYYIVLDDASWLLRNIVYKTTSGVSVNAVKYRCDVPQNIDITKSGWSDKIVEIPEENERDTKCTIEKE